MTCCCTENNPHLFSVLGPDVENMSRSHDTPHYIVTGEPGLVAFTSAPLALLEVKVRAPDLILFTLTLPRHQNIDCLSTGPSLHPSLVSWAQPPSSSVTAPREDNDRNEFVGLMFCAPLNTIIRTRPPPCPAPT